MIEWLKEHVAGPLLVAVLLTAAAFVAWKATTDAEAEAQESRILTVETHQAAIRAEVSALDVQAATLSARQEMQGAHLESGLDALTATVAELRDDIRELNRKIDRLTQRGGRR